MTENVNDKTNIFDRGCNELSGIISSFKRNHFPKNIQAFKPKYLFPD